MQQKNEKDFVDTLDNLFDIAHMDAMKLMTIEEDKQFLTAQREKGRLATWVMLIQSSLQKKVEHKRDELMTFNVNNAANFRNL